jgi:hypothetical protein
MTTPDRREILERVASGDLTPEEAEALLSGRDPEVNGEPAPSTAPVSAIKRIKVAAGFGAIHILGDPDVAEAEIDGLHTATVDGDTLVISGEMPDIVTHVPGVFSINIGKGRRGPRGQGIGRRVHTVNLRRGGQGALRIRMNPALELDARLDAGPLSIGGLTGPIRARSSAGPITIDGARAPLDVAVNAGAIRITALLIDGDSRIRSDAGGIRIELDPASSVHISASAALGKVVLPGMG